MYNLNLCLFFLVEAFFESYHLNHDIFHFFNEFWIEISGIFQQGNHIFDFNNFHPPSLNARHYFCNNFFMHGSAFNFIVDMEN